MEGLVWLFTVEPGRRVVGMQRGRVLLAMQVSRGDVQTGCLVGEQCLVPCGPWASLGPRWTMACCAWGRVGGLRGA